MSQGLRRGHHTGGVRDRGRSAYRAHWAPGNVVGTFTPTSPLVHALAKIAGALDKVQMLREQETLVEMQLLP